MSPGERVLLGAQLAREDLEAGFITVRIPEASRCATPSTAAASPVRGCWRRGGRSRSAARTCGTSIPRSPTPTSARNSSKWRAPTTAASRWSRTSPTDRGHPRDHDECRGDARLAGPHRRDPARAIRGPHRRRRRSLKDISELERVRFVMKGGKTIRNDLTSR
jgi:hypothetical protein